MPDWAFGRSLIGSALVAARIIPALANVEDEPWAGLTALALRSATDWAGADHLRLQQAALTLLRKTGEFDAEGLRMVAKFLSASGEQLGSTAGQLVRHVIGTGDPRLLDTARMATAWRAVYGLALVRGLADGHNRPGRPSLDVAAARRPLTVACRQCAAGRAPQTAIADADADRRREDHPGWVHPGGSQLVVCRNGPRGPSRAHR